VKGMWHTGSCGGGSAVAAFIAVAGILGLVYITARAVAEIPWWVWASFTVAVVAAIAGGVRLIVWLHKPPPADVQQAWHAAAEEARALRAPARRPELPAAPVEQHLHFDVHLHGDVPEARIAAAIDATRTRGGIQP
jgi:hypothetical protein